MLRDYSCLVQVTFRSMAMLFLTFRSSCDAISKHDTKLRLTK